MLSETEIDVSIVGEIADDNKYVESQTPSGSGNLTLTSTLTLNTARLVVLTCASDERSRTFTINGLNRYGVAVSESIPGNNGTTSFSVLNYLSITSISVDAATAGAIEFGSAVIIESAWVPLQNTVKNGFKVGVVCSNISGGLFYVVRVTNDLDALNEQISTARSINQKQIPTTQVGDLEIRQESPILAIRGQLITAGSNAQVIFKIIQQ